MIAKFHRGETVEYIVSYNPIRWGSGTVLRVTNAGGWIYYQLRTDEGIIGQRYDTVRKASDATIAALSRLKTPVRFY